MVTTEITPSQNEVVLRKNDFIVSKTDNVGRLTYCNPIFIEFSGYTEIELLGKQHNVIRHPDMPRAVFNLLWNTVRSGKEFMGYVKNLCKDGSYYWVYATVTPSYAPCNPGIEPEIIGYFSVRRKPDIAKLALIQDLYRDMLIAERREDRRDTIAAGMAVLNNVIQAKGKTYHEFIHTL
ncbi:MAG: aerotaxis receptor Aer [Methylomonas sp.]|nr:MAG: aerotaxis receptor Aer [Methylomonas sp.]